MAEIKTIGILGGTFDPIHYGHLAAAECARDECRLDQIIFMPSARPPHKDLDGVLNSRHRCAMTSMAIKDNPAFTISEIELKREGLSYTVESIEAFLRDLPGVELYFILGVDALLLLNTWKDVDRLATLCRFIVVTRPGYQLDKQAECFRSVPALFWTKVVFLAVPGIYISSSEIRQRVAQGKTIKYLVPPEVEQYIAEYHLYKDREDDDD